MKNTSNKIITNIYLPNMKSKLKYLLIGDSAIVDAATGKLSIIGLFNDINIAAPAKKATLSFVVAGQLYAEKAKDGETAELTINIIKPDGTVLMPVKLKGDVDKSKKIQFVAYLQFIEFETPGEYKIQVLLNNEPSVKDDRLCFFNVVIHKLSFAPHT